jgi:predicted PurR-regulated permease PerM
MEVTHLEASVSTGAAQDDDQAVTPVRRRTVWTVLTGAFGAITGLAPHVLHHVGPLVGTALVAGAGGTALFGVLGLVASIPMLVKLKRRFSSWWAPAIALLVFAGMFTFTTVVLGPQISGGSEPSTPGVTTTIDHNSHHPSGP